MTATGGRGIERAADVVSLARALVAVETVNPPGNERSSAQALAARLERAGMEVELVPHGPERAGLIGRLPGSGPALCLSGHLDTVGIGTEPWTADPFSAEIAGDRLYGRGSSDMKGGVAAIVYATERAAARAAAGRPIVIALSAGEETGCEGALALAGRLDQVGALLVAEPTGGAVAAAHKGVAWIHASARGRAAHASAPGLGDNAVQRMARFLVSLDELRFEVEEDPLLGRPTRSVGVIRGGGVVNVVPDACEAQIDLRLTPAITPDEALAALRAVAEPEIELRAQLALPAISTPLDDPWLGRVLETVGGGEPRAMPYFTDASVLAPACGNPPVVVLGPGEPENAHRRDEWCSLQAIRAATEVCEALISDWRSDLRLRHGCVEAGFVAGPMDHRPSRR